MKPTESSPAEPPAKRLVMVATNKGGVGKSTALIHIGDYLKEKGIPFVAFDPDHANASFARFFQDEKGQRPNFMRLINTADDVSLDQITKVFDDGEANLVLVDGVGAQQEAFLRWIEEINLFERAKDMNLKITFIIIIDEDKDTVDQAKDIADRVADQVDYLVIKNLKNTTETHIYDASPARKVFTGMLKAKEITFPKLKGPLVSIIQSGSLLLSQAETSEEVYVNDRYRIGAYRSQINKQLDSAKNLITP